MQQADTMPGRFVKENPAHRGKEPVVMCHSLILGTQSHHALCVAVVDHCGAWK